MRQDKGMTTLGFIGTLAMVAFFGMIAMRLTPIYIRYFNIRQSLYAIQKQDYWGEEGTTSDFEVKTEIRKAFTRYLDVNTIRNVEAKDLEIKRVMGKGFEVSLSYDEQTPLFFNIELLVHFDKTIMISRTD